MKKKYRGKIFVSFLNSSSQMDWSPSILSSIIASDGEKKCCNYAILLKVISIEWVIFVVSDWN